MAGSVTPVRTTPAYWCERVVHRSVQADEVASWTAFATHSPVRAVLHISRDAWKMAAGLSPHQRRRVLCRLATEDRIAAMAGLHRGEPCGLALLCGGTWVEWSAAPIGLLPLVTRTGPACPGADDRRDEGFGAPLTAADRW
ncbi:hypothetical protein [Streptomyces sp. NPDC048650]|uniref:hypothetical protein n=1 Tax=unclassified Streptomyces TaxID=2593676 RepID=UPI00371AD3E0